MAKTGDFKVEGFPDFNATLNDLKAFQKCPVPTYQVCVGSGQSLVIKEALVQFWASKPDFAEKVSDLVDKHDKEFNTGKLKRGLASQQDDGNDNAENPEPESKRLCLSTAKSVNELEAEYAERFLWLHSKFSSSFCHSQDNDK